MKKSEQKGGMLGNLWFWLSIATKMQWGEAIALQGDEKISVREGNPRATK